MVKKYYGDKDYVVEEDQEPLGFMALEKGSVYAYDDSLHTYKLTKDGIY